MPLPPKLRTLAVRTLLFGGLLLGLVAGHPSSAGASSPLKPLREQAATFDRERWDTDADPDDPLTFSLFGRPLTLGGELEVVTDYLKDVELDDTARDDRARLESELQVSLLYRPADRLVLFIEGRILVEWDAYAESGPRSFTSDPMRGESWLYMGDILGSPLSLQLGRQNFADEREWWWEADLDAVRVYVDLGDLHAQVAVAQEVAQLSPNDKRIDPEENDVLRVLGHVAWRLNRNVLLEGFALYHHDLSDQPSAGDRLAADNQDLSDATLLWFGVRLVSGVAVPRGGVVRAWLDAAAVVGEETLLDVADDEDDCCRILGRETRDVWGWALDLGLSWHVSVAWRPTLTLAYAMGTGDRGGERGHDRSFRQTGLQGNTDRFGGVNRFAYYGELLDPELSNLHIWTAALGFRPWPAASVVFVYHRYRQIEPVPFLRNARLEADPEGVRREVGQEWDLVIGLELLDGLTIELFGSVFRAGPAFGALDGERAYQVTFKITYGR